MPCGYWLVRLVKGEDIRNHGSGNIGGTNVWRVFGRRLGLPVVLLDILKGFAPALVGSLVVGDLAGVLAGAAAMLGHWRPLFLRFQQGGKMVATAWRRVPRGRARRRGWSAPRSGSWSFSCLRYASLASMVAALSLPVVGLAAGRVVAGDQLCRRRRRRGPRSPPDEHRAARGRDREPLSLQERRRRCRLVSPRATRLVPCAAGSGRAVVQLGRAARRPCRQRSASTSCAWIVSKLSCRASRKSPSARSG